MTDIAFEPVLPTDWIGARVDVVLTVPARFGSDATTVVRIVAVLKAANVVGILIDGGPSPSFIPWSSISTLHCVPTAPTKTAPEPPAKVAAPIPQPPKAALTGPQRNAGFVAYARIQQTMVPEFARRLPPIDKLWTDEDLIHHGKLARAWDRYGQAYWGALNRGLEVHPLAGQPTEAELIAEAERLEYVIDADKRQVGGRP